MNFDDFIPICLQGEQLIVEFVKNFPEVVHVRNSIGETVLHYFAIENRIDIVSTLLALGGQARTGNKFGKTALQEVRELGLHEMAILLEQNGG